MTVCVDVDLVDFVEEELEPYLNSMIVTSKS
jgi:hypothetical protein